MEKKRGVSDGVRSKGRSLYVILQEFISTSLKLENYYEENVIDKYPISIETEKLYYKNLFDSYYPYCDNIVPYFWMPLYSNATDPSARTLDLYHDKKNAINEHNIHGNVNPIYYHNV